MRIALLCSCLLLGLASAARAQGEREVAIVVHSSNQLDRVTLDEVREYFLLERQQWPDQKEVHVYLKTSGGFEAEIMNAKVYGRHAGDVRSRRLQKVMSHDAQATPALPSSKSIKRAVSRDPQAIGFIDASLLDDSIKTLRVDGRQPSQPGYPLAEASPDNE